MSHTQISYDDPAHLHSHEQSHHMGMAVGRNQSPSRLTPHPSFDNYMLGEFTEPLPFHLHPATNYEYLLTDQQPSFRDMYLTDGSFPPYESVQSNLQHLAPLIPPSSQLLYPPIPTSRSQPAPQAHFLGASLPISPSSTVHRDTAPTIPPLSAHPSSSWAPAEPQSAPPPQPSWMMSGSLDPATGVYSRAPEHPRLRTAQACEKCRVRKAKCSGERPCERCRKRGLDCVYATERRMRGPNKEKKKGTSTVEAASARRASVVSTASTSSNGTADSLPFLPKSPVSNAVKKSIKLDQDRTSPILIPTSPLAKNNDISAFSSTDNNFVFEQHSESSRREKLRPPPIDLSSAREYVIDPQLTQPASGSAALDAHYNHDDPSSLLSDRQISLPSHLLESYSHVAQGAMDSSSDMTLQGAAYEPTNTIHDRSTYQESPLSDTMSIHSLPRSYSSSISSAPITPTTLTHSFHEQNDFIYPDEFALVNAQYSHDLQDAHSHSPDSIALDHHYGVSDQSAPDSNEHWSLDLDIETPTIGSNGKEKNLDQLESQMLVAHA